MVILLKLLLLGIDILIWIMSELLFLSPTNEVCEGYVFTVVCMSTEDICHTPGQTHPLAHTHTLLGRHPLAHIPLGRHPLAPPWHTQPLGRHPHPLGRHPQHLPAHTPLLAHTPWADIPAAHTPPWHTLPLDRHPPGTHTPPPTACWDTVNKRAVRIPLECILVLVLVYFDGIK